jgi:hypothetical protein
MKTFQEFIGESELDDLRRDLMSLGYAGFTATIEAYGSTRIAEHIDRYTRYYEGISTGYGDTKEEALRHAILSLFMAIENPDHSNEITKKNIVDADIREMEFQSALKNKKIDLSALTVDYDLHGFLPVSFGEGGGDLNLLGNSHLTLLETSRY